MKDLQDKYGGVVSKQRLYQLTAVHAIEAIGCLVDAMRNGENYATKVGAAKTILAKCVPDLKANELTDEGAKTLEGLVRIITSGNSSK